jgi:hypothetical protein
MEQFYGRNKVGQTNGVARIFVSGPSNHNGLAGQVLQIFKKSKLFVHFPLFGSIA